MGACLVSLGLGIAGLFWVHLLRSAWGSLGSFGFLWLVRVCRVGRLVRSGSPSSFGSALCSFPFLWFVWERPGNHCVRSSSSCSSGCAVGVAGFVRVRLLSPFAPWLSLCSFGFHLVRLGTSLVSFGSHGFVCFVSFVRVHPGCLRVRFASFGSSGFALVVAEFVAVRLVRPCAL